MSLLPYSLRSMQSDAQPARKCRARSIDARLAALTGLLCCQRPERRVVISWIQPLQALDGARFGRRDQGQTPLRPRRPAGSELRTRAPFTPVVTYSLD